MKFVCDSCHAQYLISDEKVGPNGVIVRCKKCQHKIVVKRAAAPEAEESTVVASAPPTEAAAGSPPATPPATDENKLPAEEKSSGIDDELGRAFESVLAKQDVPDGDSSSSPTAAEMPAVGAPSTTAESLGFGASSGESPAPAMAASSPESGLPGMDDDEDSDRQSTRVVNLSQMASMIKAEAQQEAAAQVSPPPPEVFEEKKEKAKEKKNGTNGSAAPAAASGAEWFVAINDSQVGPLTMEGVGEKWEKGELSADSLCWKTGMPDWKPLSSVPELAEKLAPRPPPADKEPPAGATATGTQAPAPTPLPPQQDEPGEPEWKPSAASALASLVQDELEALAKPPEKKEEPPPAAEAPKSGGGLLGDLPEASGSRPALQAPVAAPAPAAAAAAPEQDFHAQATLPLTSRRGSLDIPEEPAPPVAQPERRSRPPQRVSRPTYEEDEPQPYRPPPKSNTALLIGGGIGALVVVCITVVVIFSMTRTPQQPAQPQQPAVPPVAVASPTPPTPVNPVVPPAAQPANPVVPANPPPAVDVKPAEPATPPAAPDKVANPEPKAPIAEPKQPKAPAEPRVAKAPTEPKQPKETPKANVRLEGDPEDTKPTVGPKPTGKGVDDDFDKIFGGGGGAKEPDAPKPAKDKPKTVYIPPAAGSGSAPAKASLEQSDIMMVVVENKGMIKACVDETKAKDPGATGTVVMRWTIMPSGNVSNIQTVTEEFRKTPLSACLTAGIKKFKFQAYSGAQMAPVNFPFKF